ncbi:hypothetical protein [Hydrogenivirga sp.]
MLGALVVLLVVTLALSFGQEFSFVPPERGSYSTEEYFDEIGLPDIKLKVDCPRNSKVCYLSLINDRGHLLVGPYSDKYNSLRIEGKSRFRGRALAFVSRSYRSGDRAYTEYFLINDAGRRVDYGDILNGAIEVKPLPDGNVLVVSSSDLTEYSPDGAVFTLQLPLRLEYAYAGNNPTGLVAVVGAGGNDLLFVEYLGERSRFLIDHGALTRRGDRLGILSIYPEREGLSYAAVYRYVNEYNKGLIFYELNFAEGSLVKGHLFNSELRNVGFDPSVFSLKDRVVVSAKNSTEGGHLHFVIPKEDIPKIALARPEHIRGFEYEKNAELILSARFSALSWNALSEVKKGSTTYAKVKYDMSNSIFYGTSVEGRVGDTQIAVSYLQNKAEEKGGLKAKTSRVLSAVIDFHGLFGRSTLRIGYEQGSINGIAKFTDVQNGTTSSVVFETDLKTFYGYVMFERGLYGGLEFISYKIPSAVGYSYGGSVVYYDFDPNFRLNSLLLVAGYDKVSYARRYETNFNQFYFAGNLGFGLGKADVSGRIRDRAIQLSGASDDQIPLYMVLKGYGEFGYIVQRRARVLKGLGFSLNLGYRFTGMFIGAGNDGDGDQDKVYLEFSRYELLHGPFLQANVIF